MIFVAVPLHIIVGLDVVTFGAGFTVPSPLIATDRVYVGICTNTAVTVLSLFIVTVVEALFTLATSPSQWSKRHPEEGLAEMLTLWPSL